MTINITIQRGGVISSVTIRTIEISDDYSNQIRPIILPTVPNKAEDGPKINKVIDLLKISHTMQVRGVLTSTTDRNNLISIFKGGYVDPTKEENKCLVTYDTYPGSPLKMFMEKLMITEKAIDKSANNLYKYEVQLTLFEGTKA